MAVEQLRSELSSAGRTHQHMPEFWWVSPTLPGRSFARIRCFPLATCHARGLGYSVEACADVDYRETTS